MTRIAIIIGSTRPGRRAVTVADWVAEVAAQHPAAGAGQAVFEVIDLVEYDLPLLDEPVSPFYGDYRQAHTRRWAETVAAYDGFLFVTPEYNHSVPAALKNAIDYLYAEWHNRAAGFVSYGVNGGVRAVEHLRLALGELKVASVGSQVALSVFTDFEPSDAADPEAPEVLAPGEGHEAELKTMLDELIAWAGALKALRGRVEADDPGMQAA